MLTTSSSSVPMDQGKWHVHKMPQQTSYFKSHINNLGYSVTKRIKAEEMIELVDIKTFILEVLHNVAVRT